MLLSIIYIAAFNNNCALLILLSLQYFSIFSYSEIFALTVNVLYVFSLYFLSALFWASVLKITLPLCILHNFYIVNYYIFVYNFYKKGLTFLYICGIIITVKEIQKNPLQKA